MGLDDCGPMVDDKGECMMCPDIQKMFTRSGTACSPAITKAFNEDDRAAVLRLAGSAAIARAYQFAGSVPTISEKFLNFAEECQWDVDFELEMKVGATVDDKGEFVDHIRLLNGTCTNEDQVLKATGFEATVTEKNAFQDYVWFYDTLCFWADFRGSLPKTWRS